MIICCTLFGILIDTSLDSSLLLFARLLSPLLVFVGSRDLHCEYVPEPRICLTEIGKYTQSPEPTLLVPVSKALAEFDAICLVPFYIA